MSALRPLCIDNQLNDSRDALYKTVIGQVKIGMFFALKICIFHLMKTLLYFPLHICNCLKECILKYFSTGTILRGKPRLMLIHFLFRIDVWVCKNDFQGHIPQLLVLINQRCISFCAHFILFITCFEACYRANLSI